MEKFFVSRPIFALSLAIVIVLVGLISILNLPIEQYPDITPPVVEVSATYDGADAETVNNAVATPVAQAVMGVSDMLYMQSTSANDGSMVLQVVFDVGTDPDLVSRELDADVEKQLLYSAIQKLNKREKSIVGLRYGLGGGQERTQKEVADMMGISQSYISRLEKRIIKQLHEDLSKMA